MDLRQQNELRSVTALQRTPPGETAHVRIKSSGNGLFPEQMPAGPLELHIETTTPAGDLSPWLADEWWTEVIPNVTRRSVSVHIESTPEALIHPVVLYQLAMLRRVCPRWRLVGHAYRDSLTSQKDLVALARSPYHEVRVIDGPRPSGDATGVCGRSIQSETTRLQSLPHQADADLELSEVFARVRSLQTGRGAGNVILVRVPAAKPSAKAMEPGPGKEPSRRHRPTKIESRTLPQDNPTENAVRD